MSNLNLKHTPAEKPRTGRCSSQPHLNRKMTQPLPDFDFKDTYEPKRKYKINLIRNRIKECVYKPKEDEKKPHPKKCKKLSGIQITMRKYGDDCREE